MPHSYIGASGVTEPSNVKNTNEIRDLSRSPSDIRTPFPQRLERLVGHVKNVRRLHLMSGVSERAIHRYLKGEADPALSSLEKFAEVTGCSLAWLTADVGPMFPDENHQVVALPIVTMADGALRTERETMADAGWLRDHFKVDPARLRLLHIERPETGLAVGDYAFMELLDQDAPRITGGLYLLRLNDVLLIKPVQVLPGKLRVLSTPHEAFEVALEDLARTKNFALVGRIRERLTPVTP